MLIVEFILLFIMMAINIATSEEVGFSLFKFLVRFLSFFILFLLAATDELQYSIQHYFRLSLPLQQATVRSRMPRSVSVWKLQRSVLLMQDFQVQKRQGSDPCLVLGR